MSDSHFSENQNASDEPWTDSLVDTLLRETAEGGKVDEAFLASVEKAIDAECDSVGKVAAIAQPNSRRPWIWSSGIAAVLVAGGVTVLTFVQLREDPPEFAHTIFVEPLSEIDFAMVEKLEQPKVDNFAVEPDEMESQIASGRRSPVSEGDLDGLGVVLSEEAKGSARIRHEELTTRLDVSGIGSGEIVRIGGGFEGLNEIPTLEERIVDSNGQFGALAGTVAIGIGGDILVSESSGSSITGYEKSEISVPTVPKIRTAAFYDIGEVHDGPMSQSSESDSKFDGTDGYDTFGHVVVRAVNQQVVESEIEVTADGSVSLNSKTTSLATALRPAISKTAEGKADSLAQNSASETTALVTHLATLPDIEDKIPPSGELPAVGRLFQKTNRSAYGPLADNPWFAPLDNPLSTFSVDVDTASWTNLRTMIRSGRSADAIPNDAVRIEELINYFSWNYPQPDGEHPFAFATETAECPWNTGHRLMRVGIQGREIAKTERPDANLVFLLDVSGSMDQPEKLPLVKRAISVLVEELKELDTVTIVVYAGAEGLALRPTSGRDQTAIQNALDNLGAGGSTNGGAGIKLAYKMAREQYVEGGINRVILCTDGDFNVGTTGTEQLVSLVEKEAESGVFLSVCGFGQDNLNDAMLEEITNKGNGNYAYIDDFREARKVFLQDLMGTLMTIAKDVKIQIEFNPAQVDGYRLIGYANRKLEAEDFENDEIDAGEVGSGHAVTALYEIVPAGAKNNPADDDIGLRYQAKERPAPKRKLIPSGELALLKLRYKMPDGDTSILMERPVMPAGKNFKRASEDFRFASAVGLFGMILREHKSVGDATFADVLEIASQAKGVDPQGWRAEFVDLVKQLADR